MNFSVALIVAPSGMVISVTNPARLHSGSIVGDGNGVIVNVGVNEGVRVGVLLGVREGVTVAVEDAVKVGVLLGVDCRCMGRSYCCGWTWSK